MNRIVFLAVTGMLVWACSEKTPASTQPDGQVIFEKYCVLCHGKDGALGLNGAGDLTKSTLTVEEKVTRITRGKGMMTPYEGILTPEEIRAVALYTQQLKRP